MESKFSSLVFVVESSIEAVLTDITNVFTKTKEDTSGMSESAKLDRQRNKIANWFIAITALFLIWLFTYMTLSVIFDLLPVPRVVCPNPINTPFVPADNVIAIHGHTWLV